MTQEIWTVTVNDDCGVETFVYRTQEEADQAAYEWIQDQWDEQELGPCPNDWSEAYSQLCEQPLFLNTISIRKHNI